MMTHENPISPSTQNKAMAPLRLIRVGSGRPYKPTSETPIPTCQHPGPPPEPLPTSCLDHSSAFKKKTSTRFPYEVFNVGRVLKNVKSAGAKASPRVILQKPCLSKQPSISHPANSTFELLATNTILHDMEKLKLECSKILQNQLSEHGFLPEIKTKPSLSRITSAGSGFKCQIPISIPPPRVTINMNNEFYFNNTNGHMIQNPRNQNVCGKFLCKKKLAPVQSPSNHFESRPDSKCSEDLNQTGHFVGEAVTKKPSEGKIKLGPVSAPPRKDLARRIMREKAAINGRMMPQTTNQHPVVYLRKYKRGTKVEEKREPTLNITFGTGQPGNTPESGQKHIV